MSKRVEKRRYPICCTSAFCGKSGPECNADCPNWKGLQDFKQWVKDNNAVCIDPIWSPNTYTTGG